MATAKAELRGKGYSAKFEFSDNNTSKKHRHLLQYMPKDPLSQMTLAYVAYEKNKNKPYVVIADMINKMNPEANMNNNYVSVFYYKQTNFGTAKKAAKTFMTLFGINEGEKKDVSYKVVKTLKKEKLPKDVSDYTQASYCIDKVRNKQIRNTLRNALNETDIVGKHTFGETAAH